MPLNSREREGEETEEDPYSERAKIAFRSCGNGLFCLSMFSVVLLCDIVCLCACERAYVRSCMSWPDLFVSPLLL